MYPKCDPRVVAEAERCAQAVFHELTGGAPRSECWYRFYLCDRHGGAPLFDPNMHSRQIAYWDGEDIILDPKAPPCDLCSALPEELTHRLSSREYPRFEYLNFALRYAGLVPRHDFQEMVGQRVAQLFDESKHIKIHK
jgi:hypothetical protein